MKKKKLCCKKLTNYIELKKSNFLSLKSGTLLLDCGNHFVTIKTIERLIKAMDLQPKGFRLPSESPNKLMEIPLIVPIAFCPFCGKKLKSKF
ncbi:MAG: hypothetical protein ABIA97_03395 [Candidatus Omnitrophota bacterium]